MKTNALHSVAYGRYAIFILFLVSVMNFVDRQIMTILAQPIKADLGLSDSQLGVLTGFAFGLVYCSLGIPVARLADRTNRVWVVGASLAIWSAFTVLCGRAMSYPALVLARMGVGVGEAGCMPPGMALVTDYAEKGKRASALAFFAMGTPIGTLLGLALGGIVADIYGWRTAFLIAGLPGLLLAILVFATLRDPKGAFQAKEKPASQPRLKDVFSHLRGKRAFWLLAFAAAAKAFVAFGQQPFIAAFFLRVHGDEVAHWGQQIGLKPIGTVGLALGLLAGVFGAASNWIGGRLADRYGAQDIGFYAILPAVAALAAIPFFCIAMLVPSAVTAYLFLIPGSLLGGLWFGPVLAAVQGLSPREMRSTTTSLFLFILNMVGMGLGAVAVGCLSDMFNHGFHLGDAEGLRWALVVSSLFAVSAAVLFWMARKPLRVEVID